MIANFLKKAAIAESQARDERQQGYREQAVKDKASVVERYRARFPLLSEELDLAQGEPVWLCHKDYDPKTGLNGYGASGVLVEGYIFAKYASPGGLTFAVGKYEGEGVVLSRATRLYGDDPRREQLLASWLAKDIAIDTIPE